MIKDILGIIIMSVIGLFVLFIVYLLLDNAAKKTVEDTLSDLKIKNKNDRR